MRHIALLTYHPNVGTFRGHRGAWRVAVCNYLHADERPTVVDYYRTSRYPIRALRMEVPWRLPTGTWVNPTKLLGEVHRLQRARRQCAMQHAQDIERAFITESRYYQR